MPSDSMIMDAASKQAFYRGEALVASGAATLEGVRRTEGGAVEVWGAVAGRDGSDHRARVLLDPDASQVVSHECTCAHPRANGMCRHCVAVALRYLDLDGQDGAPEQPDSAGEAPNGELVARLKAQTQDLLAQYRAESRRADRPAAIQEPQTSAQIAKAVWACSRGGLASPGPLGAQGDLASPAELEVVLAPAGRTPGTDGVPDACAWEVRLRVSGAGARYQVKDVDRLLDAWERGSLLSYGRNLCFRHVRRNFTDRAGAVLDVLGRVGRSQRADRTAARARYGQEAAGHGRNARAIALSDADTADLLDALEGAELQFEPRVFSGSAKPRALRVVAGDPRVPVSVRPASRGGFDVGLPLASDCVLTADRLYLLHDGRAWRCSDAYRTRMGAFWRAVLPTGQELHVRDADMPSFCGAVLPLLREEADLDAPAGLDALLPPPARPAFRVSLARDRVTCEATVRYGGAQVGLFAAPEPGQPLRDEACEAACREAVARYFDLPQASPAEGPRMAGPEAASFPLHDTERLYALLTGGLGDLAAVGEVLASDALRSMAVRPAPRMRVNAAVHGGLLSIAVDSGDLSPHDLQLYLAAFERRERFARLGNGDLVRIDDAMRSLADMADDLGVDVLDLLTGRRELPASRALFVEAAIGDAPGVEVVGNDAYRAIAQSFEQGAPHEHAVPGGLRGRLRPYQQEGFSWLCSLADLGFGGILADDMGLGKTLQVIAFLLARRDAGSTDPSLVVCPASLIYNWASEIARFAPELSVALAVGHREEREALVRAYRSHDVVVTSYELLKRDIDLYARRQFYCQVLDEAQYIKNHATQAARCAKRVHAHVRLALTGTPIENRLSELWSIFDFLTPGLLGTYDRFRRRFELPVAEGDPEARERLQRTVGPFVLRRMKGDVLRDLPEKTESVVFASMEGEQEKLYRATASQLALTLAHQLPQDFSAGRIAVLAELTKLRQICCDPSLLYENYEGGSAKLETCLELVANAVDAGHKVLLFSQFTSMLSIIAERLDAAGIAHHRLVGATAKEERARLVASFQTDDVPVFLVSLKAGGVGLNLTAADIVIHYDPWWNLAAQNQATDRAHRIGQTNKVTVMRLIAKGTVEEKILELQETKRDLAESIIGGSAMGSASLSREDILALLEP